MKTSSRLSFLFALAGILAGFSPDSLSAQLPAFPGAEGFGAHSLGGRGGKIYEVTNLNDSGPGSLREAIEASGPRIVVFRVSGTIALKKNLVIRNPYITIAGQTAPGDGICLKDYQLSVNADHVVVRFLRCRPADNMGASIDSLSVSEGERVIIDHCSASWSVDETLSVSSSSPDLKTVTVQWCLITESLHDSVHSKGPHGYGSLIRGSWGAAYSFHHNYYAHHRARSPLLLDFRNNVIYNWHGSSAGYNSDSDSITKLNYIGNYLKLGVNSTEGYAYDERCRYSRSYFEGNFYNGRYPADPWSLVRFSNWTSAEIAAYKQDVPFAVAQVTTDDALTAYKRVLRFGGAILPKRDAVDIRVLKDVQNGTGTIIDDEDQVGGWPTLASGAPPVDSDHDSMPDDWESARGLDPNDADDGASDRDGDGYTNVEEYLNSLVPPVFYDSSAAAVSSWRVY
ncbi:hypothetical protein AMJ85_11550 [candidate division BRC1 bacterium SM23_51]|nr:MAG: hypothetical protein AMJ85_11550 [candidate division BRC1 bacterium SM23_51]